MIQVIFYNTTTKHIVEKINTLMAAGKGTVIAINTLLFESS